MEDRSDESPQRLSAMRTVPVPYFASREVWLRQGNRTTLAAYYGTFANLTCNLAPGKCRAWKSNDLRRAIESDMRSAANETKIILPKSRDATTQAGRAAHETEGLESATLY